VQGIRAQIVLYDHDIAGLTRLFRSLVAAVGNLRDRGGHVAVEVAIGDCGGTDGPDATLSEATLAALHELAAAAEISLTYVCFGENLGHGKGHNELARRARPDHSGVVLTVNPDTYLTPRCLTALVSAFSDETVGIAEARQIPLEHPKPFDRTFGDTPWASGCLMGVRASVFEHLGGFEKAFFLHGDDVDLSWRVRLRRHRVVHVPTAAVFHDKRPVDSGFPQPSPEEEYHSMWARLVLAHRAEREDVVARWTKWAERSAPPLQRQAARAFAAARDQSELPATYREALGTTAPEVAAVAVFHEAEYAEHRF
jgi:GT2 family glycosyltransferase